MPWVLRAGGLLGRRLLGESQPLDETDCTHVSLEVRRVSTQGLRASRLLGPCTVGNARPFDDAEASVPASHVERG